MPRVQHRNVGLLSFAQGPQVEYSLRAIPLGGYVGFPDDDPESPFPKDDPDLLRNKGIPARALVISAGIIANIVFAYSVLLAQVHVLHFLRHGCVCCVEYHGMHASLVNLTGYEHAQR